jgi:tetratricopeptide (TPR) repeat protein
MSLQEQFDEAMFEFSTGQADAAIERLKAVLAKEPEHFDAQLALGGAYYARGDYAAAIAEGRKAEKLRPNDQMVHTNLSRAYMKAGDKQTAEHHALQARIASWRGNMAPPSPGAARRTAGLACGPAQAAAACSRKISRHALEEKIKNYHSFNL